MTVYTLCNPRAGFRWGRDWKAQPGLPLPATEERMGRWEEGKGRLKFVRLVGVSDQALKFWYSCLHECNSCVLHFSHSATLGTACPLPALLPALSGGQQGQASAPLSSNLHCWSVLLDLHNNPQILLHRTTPNRTAPLKKRGHSPAHWGQAGEGTAGAGWAACPRGSPGAPGQPAELRLPSEWETGQQVMDFIPYGFQTDLHSMLQTW